MNLDKKIIAQIWDGCEKQIVDGYVYVKMDDLIKLELESLLNRETHFVGTFKPTMNEVATFLNKEGFKYETSVDGTTKSWIKKS